MPQNKTFVINQPNCLGTYRSSLKCARSSNSVGCMTGCWGNRHNWRFCLDLTICWSANLTKGCEDNSECTAVWGSVDLVLTWWHLSKYVFSITNPEMHKGNLFIPWRRRKKIKILRQNLWQNNVLDRCWQNKYYSTSRADFRSHF